MKTRFTTIDVCASVTELSERLTGMRVVNVYDIDNKTYLIKLQRQEEKAMLLIESGMRMHTTEFEWPKSMFPSGFSIKLRKHIKQKRLVSMRQLGVDRIIDLQFGSEGYAHHLIVELYDRGNIVLTDGNYSILNLLRKRIEKAKDDSKPDLFGTDGIQDDTTENSSLENKQKHDNNKENKSAKNQQEKKGKAAIANDDVKFSVGQVYPVEMAKKREPLVSIERLTEIVAEIITNRKDEPLKKALNPYFIYGHTLLESCLIKSGFSSNKKVDDAISTEQGVSQVMDAVKMADALLDQSLSQMCKGYIVQKIEKKPLASVGGEKDEVITFQEFHPFLFTQHSSGSHREYPSFDKAVDEFFSQIESQKLDVKALNQEKSALKKVENVKLDHEKRIKQLQSAQEVDVKKAELIELNLPLVDQAIQIVNSAIANQIDWTEIKTIVKEAQMQENPVALAIKDLRLDSNHITLMLRNPYDNTDSEEEDDDDDESIAHNKKGRKGSKGIRIDINLALTAYANAQSYYRKKKQSAVKEQKTIDHSHQAIKSAKRKAQQTIKEVAITASIQKARKTFWFEKFRWFISSENYLVIGGRDQQQNELIVKRHLTPGDIYVHADLHGASSIIVKNKPDKEPIPPKTLQEAGSMAVCYSSAWDSKIVTSAWWVYHDQVSKTAPTGEYLTTGSFMIRGKKNFLPPSYLVMGFGILLRLDDSCIEHHLNERRVRGIEEDTESIAESTVTSEADEDLILDDEGDGDGGDDDGDDEQEDKHEATHNQDVDSDEEPSLYPDTSIGVKVVGGKIQLNRELSTSSSTHDNDHNDEIYLGGGNKVNLRENREKASMVKEQKQSKPKRDNKSRGNHQKEQDEQSSSKESTQKQQQQQQQQQKRGKKAKQNKIKDKYGDQDEEERRLRMEILASAGEKKESKSQQRRLKKLNKGEKTARPVSGKKKPRQQDTTPLPWELSAQPEASTGEVTSDPMVPNDGVVDEKKDSSGDLNEKALKTTEETEDVAENDEDDDDDTDTQDFIKEGVTLLDTLTGCPTDEDALLFAVPVCAPYSAVNSYKFKVKITPGTTKKGKATKTAINAFIHQKEANQREKDLIKSVKDVDLSKYIPGKVKVSAPNLSKLKKK